MTDNALQSLISKSIPSIELLEELVNRRGASTWKIKQGKSFHVLKVAKLQPKENPATYHHDLRVYSIEREAKILKELNEFTGNMYSFSGKNDALIWVATKWMEGQSVGQLSKVCRVNYSDRDKAELLRLIIRIIEKVSDLHEHTYLHGDLQPAHFLLDAEDSLHLLDYGWAKQMDEEVIYKGALVHYCAPEIAAKILEGQENIAYHQASEIYSAASVAVLLYTGKTSTYYGTHDYQSVSYEERLRFIAEEGASNSFEHSEAPDFPELEAILNWCLEFSIEKRCPSLNEALGKLRGLQKKANGSK